MNPIKRMTQPVDLDEVAVAGHQRPTGFLEPADESMARAWSVIEQRRWGEVDRLIAESKDDSLEARIWRLLLIGKAGIARQHLAMAGDALVQAAGLAFACAMDAEPMHRLELLRQAACALHGAGFVQRRQDRAEDAERMHRCAYEIRKVCGSCVEMWETAVQLGLCADVALDFSTAQTWYQKALEHADQVEGDADRLRAVTCAHLGESFTSDGQYEDAVEATRRACDHWRSSDVGSVNVALADLKLGQAMLKWAEAMIEADDERAHPLLERTITSLQAAHEALQAFGEQCAQDAQWCRQQVDFAKRLQASA